MIAFSQSTVTAGNDAVNSSQMGGKLPAYYVDTAGAQSISGQKTFTANPIISTGNIVSGSDTIIFASNATTKKAYGDIGFIDSSITIATTQNVWHHVTSATNTLWTLDHEKNMTEAGDSVNIVVAGLYKYDISVGAIWPNNDSINIAVSINGTVQNDHRVTVVGSGKWAQVSPCGMVDIPAGQDLKLMFRNVTSATNVEFKNGDMCIHRLGE